ncbi:cardiolipin synthase [Litchfieldia alkalitelluris]|uniref:cardiolipin synthase n=1 Tax=Litchfieldia alkalitelluris TaxID=304268 RepID=UPI000996C73F|nr:cardiolipin synthase [Litchfieldia alkalitelluris]
MLTWLIPAVLVINIALMAMMIFLERRSVSSTWAWVLVLAFLPIIGFALYLIFGRNLYKYKIFKWDEESYKELNQIIETQKEEIEIGGYRYYNSVVKEYGDLAYLNLNHGEAPITQNNKLDVFVNGKEKFNSLLHDIENAKSHIHLLYYVFRDDELGNLICDALANKAKEGVKVRFLYDAYGSRNLSKRFKQKIISAGGDVEVFFPTKLFSIKINYRNHRKLAIIDGDIGYIGGFNVGNEYLGLDEEYGKWRDTHLRITGDAVDFIQTRFILDWNQAAQHKLNIQDLKFKRKRHSDGVGIQIVASGPDSKSEYIKNGYLKMILSAKHYVYIQTPYFVPDQSILDSLRIAALSGVDVRIIIPNKPDQPFVYWAGLSYIGELLQAGVKVYTYENGFVHSKTMVIDDKVATVGTANFDMRSFRLNFEVNTFLYHSQVAKQLRSYYENDLDVSKEMTIEDYQKRRLCTKIKESISRLLSPIL